MRALWIAVFVFGCGGKDAKRAPTTEVPKVAAPPPVTCAERVARLGTQLRELASATPGSMPLVQGIDAPRSAAPRPFDTRGFVIAVTRDGAMYVQGARLEGIEDARSYLDTMEKRALESFVMDDGGSPRDAKWPLYIWADRAAPAGVVAQLVAAAEPAGQDGMRPGEGQYKMKKPPPKQRTPEQQAAIEQARAAGIIGHGEAGSRSRWLLRLIVAGHATRPAEVAAPRMPAAEPDSSKHVAAQLRTSIGACKPVIDAFATASLEGVPAKEADKLVEGLPAGLRACDCNLPDVDGFEWGIRTSFGAWAPVLAWVEMPSLANGETQPIGKLVK